MSYQVLARKWRPRSFASLVGQEHVVRALTHALETGRLHHAWLFTGTRGVGKTTISRILAKALNCETGVTAEPCGQCTACTAIDADRFPDYVEMDAASNRGVDDMAALLDQALYAPVQGRYKVYMIDEVHMLTGHAFNAMLKTLEEPPAHVKFILATTDPQKIPVTVLSRCLQFNLKQMPPGAIVDHLSRVLEAESVAFDVPALRHIAKAAAGSMRDALSLLDQAIAHGAGRVEAEQVANMLGTVGDDHVFAVLDALAVGDVSALLELADGMQARSLSFDAALQTLASLFHRLAVMQFAPEAIADRTERGQLAPHAEAFDAEFLQLAYQVVIHGRDELALAPDDYAGFTMVLLRLHAFRPETPSPGSRPIGGDSPVPVARTTPKASTAPAEAAAPTEPTEPTVAAETPVVADPAPAKSAVSYDGEQAMLAAGDWHGVCRSLALGGLLRELAQHCEWGGFDDGVLDLRLSTTHHHLLDLNPTLPGKLGELLTARIGRPLRVRITLGDSAGDTPAQRDEAERRARHADAVAALEADPFVRELIERFDATLIESSVRPL